MNSAFINLFRLDDKSTGTQHSNQNKCIQKWEMVEKQEVGDNYFL